MEPAREPTATPSTPAEPTPPTKREQSPDDLQRINAELKGNTLRVYWYLLKSREGTVGVREVQRSLSFSSPALASYHLEKLVDLGLVRKEAGTYKLMREVKVEVLRNFTKIGFLVLPRNIFYASLFTGLLAYYAFYLHDLNFYSIFGLLFVALATGIFWYETLRNWSQQP